MLTRTCEGEETAHFGPWPREGSAFAQPNRLKLRDKIKRPLAFAQLTRSNIILKARRNARPGAAAEATPSPDSCTLFKLNELMSATASRKAAEDRNDLHSRRHFRVSRF
jgi:hypothetical protein